MNQFVLRGHSVNSPIKEANGMKCFMSVTSCDAALTILTVYCNKIVCFFNIKLTFSHSNCCYMINKPHIRQFYLIFCFQEDQTLSCGASWTGC